MASSNIINAVFGSGICAVTTSAYRANYGMKLRFSGIDLPTAFEVDFSNYDVMGRDSITMIGQNGEVQIPDDLLDSGLNIYAYVYLHPTDDSGVTVYTVTIPVLGRPNRTEETPTPHEQTVIEQAISALNDAVEQTAADVETTTANAQAAAQSEANASVSERAAAASASAALASQNAAESAAQSATESASGAAESARNAANSASQAAQSATSAQESAEQAERSVQSITDDVERAERAANTATGKATEASASAATASTKATQAEQSATAAAQSASSASTAAQNAASAATAAESSATDAEQAKTDAQDAQAAAETAADRAEQAEQEVLSAMDGTYENLTSGNAQQLLSTVTEANSVPYLFRPTASNADRAYLDEVVGGTVAWNQLVENGNFEATNGWVTSSSSLSVSDGIGTWATTSNSANLYRNHPVLQNHIYMLSCRIKTDSALTNVVYLRFSGTNVKGNIADSNWQSLKGLLKRTNATGTTSFGLYKPSSDVVTVEASDFQSFDLTAMFGSTIADYIYNLEQASAGAGVAYFRKLFPNDYYEYNSGELLSVEGVSSHDTVGFNLFDLSQFAELYPTVCTMSDGELNCVSYASLFSTGVPVDNVLSNTQQYYVTVELKAGTAVNVRLRLMYEDGGYQELGGTSSTTYVKYSASFSRQKKLVAVRLNWSQVGTFSVRNLCINLSDPVRNGTYEPYTERTYPLDSSLTLRGIPKLDASGNLYYDGDTYAADGTVERRYGIVDLGTLNWTMGTIGDNTVFYNNTITNIAGTSNASGYAICSKYLQRIGSAQSATDKRFVLKSSYVGSNSVLVVDNSYTDAASFKAAMSGVMLVYELAEPTTETATPYRHLQICDPNGTEEFVSTGIVPVGHNTRYSENLRAKIEGLPWNFNAIIAMTETTTTASKAYSVGDYFILNNVLYRVTSAIASGGTITIGTNCRATTIMDEIKALS